MNDWVRALAVSGTDLYAGGDFTRAGGVSANRIAKWNGSAWSTLGPGMNSPVYALAVSGPDLYVGGNFTTAGGVSANYIAKWNDSAWSALASGMNSSVYALVVSGSDLYAGGWFTTAGGKVSAYMARAELLSSLPEITTQPQSQTVPAGSNVTLTVTAGGLGLGYQWFFNSAPIAGATTSALMIANFQPMNQGNYYVVVTNDSGSATSASASLYLNWPLRFVHCQVNSNGLFQTCLVGPAGSNYAIQGWLQGSPWTPIVTNNAPHGILEFMETMLVPDPRLSEDPSSTNRFYRAWLAP